MNDPDKILKQKIADLLQENTTLVPDQALLGADRIVGLIKEAGWTQVADNTGVSFSVMTPDGLKPVMTGAEWHDRLMKEFLSVNRIYENSDDWVAKFTDFVEAAKRASGVEG